MTAELVPLLTGGGISTDTEGATRMIDERKQLFNVNNTYTLRSAHVIEGRQFPGYDVQNGVHIARGERHISPKAAAAAAIRGLCYVAMGGGGGGCPDFVSASSEETDTRLVAINNDSNFIGRL